MLINSKLIYRMGSIYKKNRGGYDEKGTICFNPDLKNEIEWSFSLPGLKKSNIFDMKEKCQCLNLPPLHVLR